MGAVGARRTSEEHLVLDPHAAREAMARRLPRMVQPFLTWLTALPAPGERRRTRTPIHFVAAAFARLVGGTVLSAAAIKHGSSFLALVPLGMVATTSGMGLLQAVVYHHCAHGTVLGSRRANRALGRFVSVLLLIKDFDAYQKEHMAHHSPRRLLTADDEFLDYLRRFIGIAPGMPRGRLWRRVVISFFSPAFHARLLRARLLSCLLPGRVSEYGLKVGFWSGVLLSGYWTGAIPAMLVAWLVPATFLFQIATSLRVLAEHRFPPSEVRAARDRGFIARTTAGVFPGTAPPRPIGSRTATLVGWTVWWVKILTVHLLSREFVLVGDAPAHDYHHRHPGSRDWPNHIRARSRDRSDGCPGFPVNYIGTLGLFRAIDENLSSLANAPPEGIADAPARKGNAPPSRPELARGEPHFSVGLAGCESPMVPGAGASGRPKSAENAAYGNFRTPAELLGIFGIG